MAHKVDICGINTAALPKISHSESMELIKAAQGGNETARDYFVLANMRLVLSLVQRFNYKGNSDDLFQVGCVGLMKALNNFNSELNVRFSTYAVPMIVGEIKRFLRDGSALKIGRSIRDVAYKAIQARERLVKAGEAEPSMYEIASEIDVPISEIASALDAISDPMSLFEPVYSDNDDNIMLMEQVKDLKENDDKWLTDLSLKEAITLLSSKEKEIIILRYYIGKTQTEVSGSLNISQAQVSRLEKSALGKIKTRIS